MPRVFSYLRVSSVNQAHKGRGLEGQSTDADAWCKEHGLQLDTSLDLTDPGLSARYGEHVSNGCLGRFLLLAQAGELGQKPILLVESIDRLSRQELIDAVQDVIFGLLRSGMVIHTMEDAQIYTYESVNSDIGKAIQLIAKIHAAAEYSKKLSRRIQRSWDQSISELEAGRLPRANVFCPQWAQLKDGQVELIPEKVAIVKRVFEMAMIDGDQVVAARLNEERIPTLSGKPEWTRFQVKNLLIDPKVWGAVVMNRQHNLSKKRRERRGDRAANERAFPDLLPLALTKQEVDQTLAARSARTHPGTGRGKRGTTWSIASGLTRCSCGGGASLKACKSGSKRNQNGDLITLRYVKCREACGSKGYRLEALNAHLLTRLKMGQLQQLFAANTGKNVQIKAEQAAISRLQGQLAQSEQAEANASKLFKEALKTGQIDPLFKEAVDEARSDAEAARKALNDAQQRLAGLRHEINSVEFDKALKVLFDAFANGEDTPEQRRGINSLLRRSGLKVTLDNKGQRVGMSIGDGEIDWQPLEAMSVQMALTGYSPGIRFMAHTITDELIQQAIEAGEDPEVIGYMQQQKGIRMVGITNKPKP